jgi:hypothetical protein
VSRIRDATSKSKVVTQRIDKINAGLTFEAYSEQEPHTARYNHTDMITCNRSPADDNSLSEDGDSSSEDGESFMYGDDVATGDYCDDDVVGDDIGAGANGGVGGRTSPSYDGSCNGDIICNKCSVPTGEDMCIDNDSLGGATIGGALNEDAVCGVNAAHRGTVDNAATGNDVGVDNVAIAMVNNAGNCDS